MFQKFVILNRLYTLKKNFVDPPSLLWMVYFLKYSPGSIHSSGAQKKIFSKGNDGVKFLFYLRVWGHFLVFNHLNRLV